jgi:hypothetical protein
MDIEYFIYNKNIENLIQKNKKNSKNLKKISQYPQ